MTAAQAVQLIRNGAWHCFGVRDSLTDLQQCLREACDEKGRRAKLRDRIPATELKQWLVGESRAMEEVLDTIRLVGPRRCTVLINGGNGNWQGNGGPGATHGKSASTPADGGRELQRTAGEPPEKPTVSACW